MNDLKAQHIIANLPFTLHLYLTMINVVSCQWLCLNLYCSNYCAIPVLVQRPQPKHINHNVHTLNTQTHTYANILCSAFIHNSSRRTPTKIAFICCSQRSCPDEQVASSKLRFTICIKHTYIFNLICDRDFVIQDIYAIPIWCIKVERRCLEILKIITRRADADIFCAANWHDYWIKHWKIRNWKLG